MTLRVSSTLVALALGIALASAAGAQNRRTVAIMPTQYFSADAESAQNVTQGLREQFERQGYTVLPADRVQSAWSTMNLGPSTHYPDRTAVRLGRTVGADLVAYPRLLAVGLPINAQATGTNGGKSDMIEPAAVIHLRVLNTHSGTPIYFNQIAHEFTTDAPTNVASDFRLPQPVAVATATEVTAGYFQRVAGSRQESRMSGRSEMRSHRTRRHHRHSRHHHPRRHHRMR
jgi:hypothetical protein